MAEKKKPAASTAPKKRASKKAEAAALVVADTAEHLPAVVDHEDKLPEVVLHGALDVVVARTNPSHDEIQRRAFEIHQARGGSAFENWLQAERELRA